MQYLDQNSIMIVIVLNCTCICICICLYLRSTVFTVLCMLVSCLSFGNTFFAKTMLSACDLSSGATGDSRGTVRYSRSTQVHPGLQSSPPPPPQGAEALQRALSELQQLKEATVSLSKRELTRRASLRGVSTIDVVEFMPAVKPEAPTKTLQTLRSQSQD